MLGNYLNLCILEYIRTEIETLIKYYTVKLSHVAVVFQDTFNGQIA